MNIPRSECAATNPMSQLQGLGNAEQIHRLGSDPLFPPSQQSIGKGFCGDSARGGEATRDCREYNQWNNINAMMKLNRDVYTAPGCKQFDGRVHGVAPSSMFTAVKVPMTSTAAIGGKHVKEETAKKPVVRQEVPPPQVPDVPCYL